MTAPSNRPENPDRSHHEVVLHGTCFSKTPVETRRARACPAHLCMDLRGFADHALPDWLGAAGLGGIIPESGPHLIFTTLYARGLVPFSVLLTSSIVQDGHGMLPMLAHSRRAFLTIKLINLLVGLAIGALLMATEH